jgi:hypothetical protein
VDARRTGFRDRGRLRRRLRYLRRVRELGFRDLGGLVFDLHRFHRQGDELVRGKLNALEQVDAELRAIERALDERRDFIELREPGIAACPRCGALHGSEAHFCPSCGVPFSGPRALAEVGEGGVTAVGEIGALSVAPAEPQPTAVTQPLDAEPVAPPPAAPAPAQAEAEPEPAPEPPEPEPQPEPKPEPEPEPEPEPQPEPEPAAEEPAPDAKDAERPSGSDWLPSGGDRES